MEKLRPTEIALRRRIFYSHLGMALLACVLCGVLLVYVARVALIERSSNQLESVRTLKKLKIEAIFTGFEDYLKTFDGVYPSQASGFDEFLAMAPFRDFVVAARFIGDSKGEFLALPSHAVTKKWEVLPLSDPDGSIFFLDQKCINDFPDTHCLTMVRRFPRGRLEIQVSLKMFRDIVGTTAGLGETGESYLVAQDGFFRTGSRFWDNAKVVTRKVRSESYFQALHGGTGIAIGMDYRGIEVVSAFTAIRRPNLNWVLLSELDLVEVLLPLSRMYQALGLVIFGTFILALGVSIVWTRNIASPVVASLRSLNENYKRQKLHRLGLYQGQELERQRLSQDLHDGIGQELTGLSLRIAATEMERTARAQLLDLVRKMTDEVRQISYGLMPAVLTNFGLRAAIENLCQSSSITSGISIVTDFESYSAPATRATMVEQHLYRIIQEIIHNALKHSHAKNVNVCLVSEGESLRLQVRDDGVGFDVSTVSGKGLTGIRERVEALDGVLELTSKPGHGTEFLIVVNSNRGAT
jgi:signal transduction histidine kinase